MHSFLSRLNTLFAFTISVLAVLTIGVFVSTYFEKYYETVSIGVNKPIVKHMTDYSANRKKNDLGVLQLNLDMNLNQLFDWNVKVLFLYLIAEYVTPANSLNQVVLWDKIIRRGENARIYLHDIATKYYFWDDGENLRSNNVTLSLAWNIIPNAGRLLHVPANGSTSFIFSDQYTTSRAASPKSNIDNETINSQDSCKSRNTITRQWFHWQTSYKNHIKTLERSVNWWNLSPTSYLGIIVHLTKTNEIDLLRISLAQLSFLLSNNPRPVAIFHEGDFDNNQTSQSLAQTLGPHTPLAFERIDFSNKSVGPPPVDPITFSRGYSDMCRLFTLLLSNHLLSS
ncbi:unnamed protein product, partial [Adineta steineri]